MNAPDIPGFAVAPMVVADAHDWGEYALLAEVKRIADRALVKPQRHVLSWRLHREDEAVAPGAALHALKMASQV